MKEYRFYKDDDGWFIDLPSFPGPKSALAMVAGADTLLDKFNDGSNEVMIDLSTKQPEHGVINKFVRTKKNGIFGGADYDYDGHAFWLCPVTLYVFGRYPKVIYFNIIRKW